MDGETLIEPSEQTDNEQISLEEQLDKLCVYYMAIGVPYDVFWYGDYCCLKYYEDAYLQKRKIGNENMWIQGMYNYTAHATTLSNAFKKKGSKSQEYLKKPLDIFPKTPDEEKREVEQLRQKVISNLTALKDEWDRKNVRSD